MFKYTAEYKVLHTKQQSRVLNVYPSHGLCPCAVKLFPYFSSMSGVTAAAAAASNQVKLVNLLFDVVANLN